MLPVRDGHDEYAREVAAALRAAGLRGEADEADEPLGARIRRAKLEKLPYVLVVGDDDVAARTVGVNRARERRARARRRARRASPTSLSPRSPRTARPTPRPT